MNERELHFRCNNAEARAQQLSQRLQDEFEASRELENENTRLKRELSAAVEQTDKNESWIRYLEGKVLRGEEASEELRIEVRETQAALTEERRRRAKTTQLLLTMRESVTKAVEIEKARRQWEATSHQSIPAGTSSTQEPSLVTASEGPRASCAPPGTLHESPHHVPRALPAPYRQPPLALPAPPVQSPRLQPTPRRLHGEGAARAAPHRSDATTAPGRDSNKIVLCQPRAVQREVTPRTHVAQADVNLQRRNSGEAAEDSQLVVHQRDSTDDPESESESDDAGSNEVGKYLLGAAFERLSIILG